MISLVFDVCNGPQVRGNKRVTRQMETRNN